MKACQWRTVWFTCLIAVLLLAIGVEGHTEEDKEDSPHDTASLDVLEGSEGVHSGDGEQRDDDKSAAPLASFGSELYEVIIDVKGSIEKLFLSSQQSSLERREEEMGEKEEKEEKEEGDKGKAGDEERVYDKGTSEKEEVAGEGNVVVIHGEGLKYDCVYSEGQDDITAPCWDTRAFFDHAFNGLCLHNLNLREQRLYEWCYASPDLRVYDFSSELFAHQDTVTLGELLSPEFSVISSVSESPTSADSDSFSFPYLSFEELEGEKDATSNDSDLDDGSEKKKVDNDEYEEDDEDEYEEDEEEYEEEEKVENDEEEDEYFASLFALVGEVDIGLGSIGEKVTASAEEKSSGENDNAKAEEEGELEKEESVEEKEEIVEEKEEIVEEKKTRIGKKKKMKREARASSSSKEKKAPSAAQLFLRRAPIRLHRNCSHPLVRDCGGADLFFSRMYAPNVRAIFVCLASLSSNTAMSIVTEISSGAYELVVASPFVCRHPAISPLLAPSSFTCTPRLSTLNKGALGSWNIANTGDIGLSYTGTIHMSEHEGRSSRDFLNPLAMHPIEERNVQRAENRRKKRNKSKVEPMEEETTSTSARARDKEAEFDVSFRLMIHSTPLVTNLYSGAPLIHELPFPLMLDLHWELGFAGNHVGLAFFIDEDQELCASWTTDRNPNTRRVPMKNSVTEFMQQVEHLFVEEHCEEHLLDNDHSSTQCRIAMRGHFFSLNHEGRSTAVAYKMGWCRKETMQELLGNAIHISPTAVSYGALVKDEHDLSGIYAAASQTFPLSTRYGSMILDKIGDGIYFAQITNRDAQTKAGIAMQHGHHLCIRWRGTYGDGGVARYQLGGDAAVGAWTSIPVPQRLVLSDHVVYGRTRAYVEHLVRRLVPSEKDMFDEPIIQLDVRPRNMYEFADDIDGEEYDDEESLW
eukprot:TRINITY_DN5899_c0_g1_i1.p1 TRINITY_DN5899_c0_g1~~TRINITY_DN5899_c0_g1_i1.p1  ORF type:complete len:920 (-),score=163.92 TRINITY_DN5899_c0_g1_i1:37-2796(-)